MGRLFASTSILIKSRWPFLGTVFLSLNFVLLTACTKSPGGSVEELIKTNPPNFGGQLTKTFLSPSTSYLLSGNCDPISYGVEWSYNNSTWTEFTGGCPAGTFSLTVVFAGRKTVYVRARTKTGYTATAIATIRLLLPPTSPQLNLVNGSNSDNEDGAGMQSSMESMLTALSTGNGVVTLQSSSVDSAYEP